MELACDVLGQEQVVLASLLDNDLYKFTQQYAVYMLYPDAQVKYKFTNRDESMTFSKESFQILVNLVNDMEWLEITDEQLEKFKSKCPFFNPIYFEALKNYRFDPDQVSMELSEDGKLDIWIEGSWFSTILWEVPLMSVISFVYFAFEDTDWLMDGQEENIIMKHGALTANGVNWADFGTRRRRNFATQQAVVEIMSNQSTNTGKFVGTSNVHLALENNIPIIGTMAHEFIMGTSALTSLRHANICALDNWNKVYHGNLGIALTDTFGTEAFFKDFPVSMAKEYDGVRHDSGDPHVFAQKVIEHYKSLGIDPKSKTIVFSDGLNTDTAIDINKKWSDKIKCSFGIGTHFTNDFKNSFGEKSKPMNMVIKLYSVNGIPVVKLSDNPAKATGDTDALRVAKYTFFGESL